MIISSLYGNPLMEVFRSLFSSFLYFDIQFLKFSSPVSPKCAVGVDTMSISLLTGPFGLIGRKTHADAFANVTEKKNAKNKNDVKMIVFMLGRKNSCRSSRTIVATAKWGARIKKAST